MNTLQVEKIKGLISVTLTVEEKDQVALCQLSDVELIQLSKKKAEDAVKINHVREALVGYDGKNVEVLFSL